MVVLMATSAIEKTWNSLQQCCSLHTVNITTYQKYYTDHEQLSTASGVLGGIRGYMAYTNLQVFLTAYTHLSDHK